MKPEKQFVITRVLLYSFALLTISFQSFGQVRATSGDDRFAEKDDSRFALLEKLEAGKEIKNSEIRETFRKHSTSEESVPYFAGEVYDIDKESFFRITGFPEFPYMDMKEELDALRNELHSVIRELKSEIKKISSEIKAEAENENQLPLFSS
jgi:vacuolar-type H+-ATPase subunit I/STV1